jgi:aminoglycoside 6'-N-acetyltransferase
MRAFAFRRVTRADLPLIHHWLKTPAVRRWWIEADGTQSDPIRPTDLDEPDVAMWLVSIANRPFAFIQDYDPHASVGHHFAYLPPGSRGVDQFIGEPDMLDRGYGPEFIRAHIDMLFAGGVPMVGTDPHPDNARAIRAYEKVGFTARAVRETPWGRCLLMDIERQP